MSQPENIYDDDSVSLLTDFKSWIDSLKGAKKPVDYRTDVVNNLAPLFLRTIEVLSARMNETEQVVMEGLNESTIQPDLATEILAVFALAEEAIASALVPSESEVVKKFRFAVAEVVPKIEEAILDTDEDEDDEEEDDEPEEEAGEAAEEQ